MQRKVIISSIISLIIITLLFFFLLTIIKKDINMERTRSEKYLASSIEDSIDLIQDNIFYLYKELANKSKDSLYMDFSDEQEILDYFKTDIILLNDFPNIISDGGKIIEINYNNTESIYINDFQGFMNFPLPSFQMKAYPQSVSFHFDLNDIIDDYLINLIKDIMDYKYNYNNDILLWVSKGEKLARDKKIYDADLIIDLNKIFDTSKINEYFTKRSKRDIILKPTEVLNEDHTYLVVDSYFSHLTKEYNVKLNHYTIGLTVVYIFLLCSLNVLFYTIYKIHQNTLREKDFTSLISHELKTPLSVIQLGADNLAEGVIEKKDDVIYYGDMIKNETLALKNMIDKILTISANTNSDKYNKFEKANIDKIISNIENQCTSLLNQSDVMINVSNSLDNNVILCNEMTLTGALFNIVQNSIRYGASFSDDRIVYINIQKKRRKYRNGISIKVTDHGPGMSWKDSRNVFKPFYRGDNMKELQLSGTGLGLSLAKKIVLNHKGYIDILLKLRKETTFEIWLPRKDKE